MILFLILLVIIMTQSVSFESKVKRCLHCFNLLPVKCFWDFFQGASASWYVVISSTFLLPPFSVIVQPSVSVTEHQGGRAQSNYLQPLLQLFLLYHHHHQQDQYYHRPILHLNHSHHDHDQHHNCAHHIHL